MGIFIFVLTWEKSILFHSCLDACFELIWRCHCVSSKPPCKHRCNFLNAFSISQKPQSSSLRGLAEGDLMDPEFQQRVEDAIALLRQEIQRELKIKEAAERLRRAVTNRKSAADVDGQLRASSRKLEQLHWELQELNARAMATQKENLIGKTRGSDHVFIW